VIVCRKCNKENQDHYKFCLGCGAELVREASAPKPFAPDTPPHGVATVTSNSSSPSIDVTSTDADDDAPSASTAPTKEAAVCPQCAHTNKPNSRFCASCGYNLSALNKGAAAPAAPAAAAPTGGDASAIKLTLTALRADGTEAGSFSVPDGASVSLGRDTGSIFAGDSYLSPRHASVLRRSGGIFIRDDGSLNGVYVKLKPQAPWPLNYGDVFRIGQEIIRFEKLEPQPLTADGVERLGSPAKGFIGRLALVIGRDTTGNAFPVPQAGVHCGRERGDVLFSEDGYVSGLHCSIAPAKDGRVYLTDVGSSNGTFVRLTNEYQLTPGDVLLMGQQLFRADL